MEVLRDGECVHIESPGLCPGDESLVVDLYGQERCVCKEGMGRINKTCQTLYYRGECRDGEVLMPRHQVQGCFISFLGCVTKTQNTLDKLQGDPTELE